MKRMIEYVDGQLNLMLIVLRNIDRKKMKLYQDKFLRCSFKFKHNKLRYHFGILYKQKIIVIELNYFFSYACEMWNLSENFINAKMFQNENRTPKIRLGVRKFRS